MIDEFWKAINARDWERLGSTVTDDVVGTWPQTREIARGRDSFIAFESNFPGEWKLEIQEAHEDSSGGATRVAFTVDDETATGITFFHFATDGRIDSFVEYWPESYEPPEEQTGRLERY